MAFFQWDKVKYTGSKYRSDLGGKIGEIVGRVEDYDSSAEKRFIVDFGDGSYLIAEKNLTRNKSTEKGPMIEHRRNFEGVDNGKGQV